MTGAVHVRDPSVVNTVPADGLAHKAARPSVILVLNTTSAISIPRFSRLPQVPFTFVERMSLLTKIGDISRNLLWQLEC